jgi:hypothetical protein
VGGRQPSTAVDYAAADTEGESYLHTSIERGCEETDRSSNRYFKISSSNNSHSSPINPTSTLNNKRNVTVVANEETRPSASPDGMSEKSMSCSNEHAW